MAHIPVLCNEVCALFANLQGVVIDCTLGFGGHSAAILATNPHVRIIGIDRDSETMRMACANLARFGGRFTAHWGCFGDIGALLDSIDSKPVAGILADLGVSSYHLDTSARGFGFRSETLDMRMDQQQILSAKEIVNRYPKDELERIFRRGEVRQHKKLAALLCERRKQKPFESARELSELIAQHMPHATLHPATLAFQALRIEVNDELGQLARLLESARGKTQILAIIAFHSLEDSMIKQSFRDFAKSCVCPPFAARCTCGNNHALGTILTKKPIVPSAEEIANNPRARSAKLRAFRFYAKENQ
ncbi:MAG: 16S rRNA (cytosine(1402)-N(4))-methyltransferase RsmH [Helicobacter sp.]|nr:16S rRNA (cytosine(1402)-N(4))-methyltransferase RsmH [Helicobacter sp.]